jgi:uncharacterized repeat protein (TIGR03803 family)
MTAPTTLVDFDGATVSAPNGPLIADASGDLFGVGGGGATSPAGVIYELQNSGTAGSPSYTGSATVVASFGASDGSDPNGDLLADSAGDLYGVTSAGGANGDGAIYELKNSGTLTAPSYASTTTLLWSFDGTTGTTPLGGLISDANGDLFGVTSAGGANGDGVIFELQNVGTASAPSFASSPTVLFSFDGTSGSGPQGPLFADATGDLIGETSSGGANGDGVLFELQNTGTASAPTYGSTPSVLFSFDGTNGSSPEGGLVADANENLFGVTSSGGANGDGVLFEIQNTGTAAAPSYASTPSVLVGFDGTDGSTPQGGLAIDAAGDLFGTTSAGGANGQGVVFELQNGGTTAAPSYASTPTVSSSFDGANGSTPQAALYANGAGDLYGVTSAGGTSSAGTLFEVQTSPATASGQLFVALFSFIEAFQNGANGWFAALEEFALVEAASTANQGSGFVYSTPSEQAAADAISTLNLGAVSARTTTLSPFASGGALFSGHT